MQSKPASELQVSDRFLHPEDKTKKMKVMNIEFDNEGNKILVAQNLGNGVIGKLKFEKNTKLSVV